MAVKIRLKRQGKIRVPQYRIVVVDSRKKRDGKVIEEIGLYRPKEEPSFIEVTSDRAQYWLGVGAQPSEAVARILEVTGDWQKFKGIDGAEGTLKVADPKRDKLEIFNEALKEAQQEPKVEAVTARKKAEKVEDAPAEETTEAAAEEASTEVAAVADVAEVADGGFGPDSAAPLEDGSAPEGFDIKGNKDSMKFHAPTSPWYGRTVAEVWFKTAEAAEAAGFVNAESKSAEA